MYLLPEEHNFIRVYCAHCGATHDVIRPCGQRFCPACGHISRWRVRERLHQIFQKMKKIPGYRLKMLTLSMSNCTDLTGGLNELIASFRRLRQSKLWRSKITGGLFVIEIQGEPGNWHPHIHSFIYSLRIEWRALRDQWHRASKGGLAVWIANITNDKAIYYVTKYVTKPGTDIEYASLIDAAMKGRRLFQRFGTFHHLKLPKRLSAKKCEKCGHSDWLTEWDFRKNSIPVP
jgi:hypothetical protein